METGITSLLAASILTAIIGSILFSFIWQINRQSSGVFEWMLAIILFPVALLFQSTQNGDSLGLTVFMTNILMAAGAILVTVGSRKFFGRVDDNVLLSLVLFVPFSITCYYFTFVTSDVAVRLWSMSLLWITSLLLSLFAALQPKYHPHGAGRIIFSTICILLTALMTFRIYSLFNQIQVASLFSSSVITFLIDVSGFIVHYGFTLSFCILCLERKEQQLIDLKQTLLTLEPLDNQSSDGATTIDAGQLAAGSEQLAAPIQDNQQNIPIELTPIEMTLAEHNGAKVSPAQHDSVDSGNKIQLVTPIEPPVTTDAVTQQQLPQARKNAEQALTKQQISKAPLQACALKEAQPISQEPAATEPGTPATFASSAAALQANLLNPVPLQRQQQKLEQQEFARIIKMLPQHLQHLTKTANEAFEKREAEKLKEILHKLAISADKSGLEQLAEMALSLELNALANITTQTFKQLEILCNASVKKLQHSEFYNSHCN